MSVWKKSDKVKRWIGFPCHTLNSACEKKTKHVTKWSLRYEPGNYANGLQSSVNRRLFIVLIRRCSSFSVGSSEQGNKANVVVHFQFAYSERPFVFHDGLKPSQNVCRRRYCQCLVMRKDRPCQSTLSLLCIHSRRQRMSYESQYISLFFHFHGHDYQPCNGRHVRFFLNVIKVIFLYKTMDAWYPRYSCLNRGKNLLL